MTELAHPVHEAATATRWWRDAVIYQVYVRSFADGNGDGIGDLLGVRSRLPYLADLGVDALWLTPFFTSPMADFGYDVADYRDVDPIFGSLADARALIDEAHRHGLRIIVDVVPNHTSDRHAWFQEALAAAPGDPARERYIFRPGKGPGGELPPNDWESVFGGSAWTRLPDGEWYLHLFAAEQPDLNWDNPEIHAEFESILRFWLDLGVDGFRIDVAHGMVKAPGLPDVGHPDQVRMIGAEVVPFFDQDGVHEIHRAWRRLLDSYPGERIGVAEAWAPSALRLANYIRPDELHQAFNFHFLTAPWDAARFRAVIDESLATAGLVGAPTTWVLSNHDVKRHVTRYGHGEAGLRRARAAMLLTLGLPGSAYIYQGEELGLPEVLDLPEEFLLDPQRLRNPDDGRDGCRVPIPWADGEPHFGFSLPGVEGTWLPMPESWGPLSVEAQLGDPRSTLNLYRDALRIRRELRSFGDAPPVWLDSPEGTLAFARDGGFACTVNLTGEPVELPAQGRVLLASVPPVVEGGLARLAPDSAVWWRRDDA
ncbi:alpha-glucosidase [Streptosporangium becharense]|uniref:Alpha-glucosidase n=1 Tax=Streptosporangium becharense TaxID=1816182 RepID=A0A7W9IM70_9ACTN|nr:glycoside hydrolase family 13 protein [Streptosporangium becharense]MBB2910162.1 alpha-glucosidase [Streptosporangium becharense]MBB5822905.1 alpha-glucosidase [Streptosporangium becharense]